MICMDDGRVAHGPPAAAEVSRTMADCEMIKGCPFFHEKMPDMPAMANMIKRRYCLGDFSGCARYMVVQARGRGTVPGDLYPNQQDRARKLIDGA